VSQACTVFLMSASDSLEQVVNAQGRAATLTVITTIASWGVHVPACFLLVRFW
jgi:MATE family multidrug resistance protein